MESSYKNIGRRSCVDKLKHTNMQTITIQVPDTVELGEKEAKMFLASKLYEKGRLTLGQAADLVGYSKETFMELLGDYGVSIINYSEDELEQDIKNASDYNL